MCRKIAYQAHIGFTRINQPTIMLELIYFSKNKFVLFLWLVAKRNFLLRISQFVFCREMIVHSVDIHFSHLSEVAGEVLTVRFCVFQSKIIVNYGIKIWIRWKSSSEIGRTLIFSQLSVEYVILHNGCHGRFGGATSRCICIVVTSFFTALPMKFFEK